MKPLLLFLYLIGEETEVQRTRITEIVTELVPEPALFPLTWHPPRTGPGTAWAFQPSEPVGSQSIAHRTLKPRGHAYLRKTRLTGATLMQARPGIAEGLSKSRVPGHRENGRRRVTLTPPTSGADSPPARFHMWQSKARLTPRPRIVCLSAPGKIVQ